MKYLVVSLALAFALSPLQAHAYAYRTCNGDKVTWESSSICYNPMTVSFPSGSSQRTALERVRTAWNGSANAPSTRYDIRFNYTNDSSWRNGDEINDVCLTWDYGWGSSTLAVCVTMYDSCWWFGDGSINETDIFFNPSVGWNLSTQPGARDGGTSLALVGVHEFGHGLGLHHEDRWMATMNSRYPNGGTLGPYNSPDPLADDCAADRVLYGSTGTSRDLAVSAYRRTGSGNSGRCRRSAFAVPRGGSLTVDWTFMNRGTITATSDVYFYASTNDYISIFDRYLGGNFGAWVSGGGLVTSNRSLTIPSDMPVGYYYLGYVIDPNNTVPEAHEGNNSVAMIDWIYVY